MKSGNRDKVIRITKKEWFILFGKTLVVMVLLDYFFFKSFWALIPLIFPGIAFLVQSYKELLLKKQSEAVTQFKELLLLSCTYMRAGYSVENAMLFSYKDLEKLYHKNSFILKLLMRIQVAKKNNKSGALVFKEIGMESGISVISEFGQIYRIAYEMSGNLTEVMERCAQGIIEKVDIENEIQKILNERIFEMKIMCLMPFLIIEYMSLINRGYFGVMYEGILGRSIMSICLLVYLGACAWGYKITSVRI